MVGVPGKYKGCETCRRRRVKCTNERPFCQKCINSGRECEGYERERVFITGTPENKGRVASHPKKLGPSPSSSSARRQRLKVESGSTPELTTPERTPERDFHAFGGSQGLAAVRPLTSAWDDYITLRGNQGTDCYALMTALQAPLQGVTTQAASIPGESERLRISLAPYTPTEMSMLPGTSMLNTTARCLVHFPGVDDSEESNESFCVFLFENSFEIPSEFGFTQAASLSSVQRMGPQSFASFPNHHYFVRVHRPMALSAALLSRRSTYLAEADWITTPWVKHPKSLLDQLLDIIAYIPSLLERADQITPLQATISRRHEAQQILSGCLALEARFEQWLQLANQSGSSDQQLPTYWAQELAEPADGLPFSHSFAFRDGLTALIFLYYWMALIPFHRCIDNLYGVIFQPVLDVFPDPWPDLPPAMQLISNEDGSTRYNQTRELAANVCRGLDAALTATAQPDILVAPMTVALDLYRDINATSQDGLLEILWLEAFRARLADKGQHVAMVMQSNSWVEIARY